LNAANVRGEERSAGLPTCSLPLTGGGGRYWLVKKLNLTSSVTKKSAQIGAFHMRKFINQISVGLYHDYCFENNT
jgi:hypothetical protein